MTAEIPQPPAGAVHTGVDSLAPSLIDHRGHSLGEVEAMAKAQRLELVQVAPCLFVLHCALGQWLFGGLSAVVQALKSSHLGGIQNPPTSAEYQRLQRLRDAQPPFVPKAEPVPSGHVTADMLAQLALPGETPPQAVARRQAERQAIVELGPIALHPRTERGIGRIGD